MDRNLQLYTFVCASICSQRTYKCGKNVQNFPLPLAILTGKKYLSHRNVHYKRVLILPLHNDSQF